MGSTNLLKTAPEAPRFVKEEKTRKIDLGITKKGTDFRDAIRLEENLARQRCEYLIGKICLAINNRNYPDEKKITLPIPTIDIDRTRCVIKLLTLNPQDNFAPVNHIIVALKELPHFADRGAVVTPNNSDLNLVKALTSYIYDLIIPNHDFNDNDDKEKSPAFDFEYDLISDNHEDDEHNADEKSKESPAFDYQTAIDTLTWEDDGKEIYFEMDKRNIDYGDSNESPEDFKKALISRFTAKQTEIETALSKKSDEVKSAIQTKIFFSAPPKNLEDQGMISGIRQIKPKEDK